MGSNERVWMLYKQEIRSTRGMCYTENMQNQEKPSHTQGRDKSGPYTTITIGWILRVGAGVSAAVILIGTLLLPLHPDELSQRSLQTFPHTLAQVWLGLLALQPQEVIALGLLLLIATPIVSVATSIITFALEHDRRYAIISLIVLAILIASLLISKGGS